MDGYFSNSELKVIKQSRPGGRAERMVSAIHQATYELLQQPNFEKIEIPDIAKLAQVNKTTVYRRWPTKVDLILDVALTRLRTDLPLPDTGNLNDDLTIFLKMIALTINMPFILNILSVLINQTDENIMNARKMFWNERFLLATPLIDRAIQRGELAETTQVRAFFEWAASPLFYRVVILGDSVSDEDIELMAQRAILIFKKKR